VVSGAIAPSAEFRPFLLSHIAAAEAAPGSGAGPSPTVAELARYCLSRVVRISEMPPRVEVPVPAEIEASRNMSAVLMRVYHLDGTFDTLPVASWVTIGLLKQMVCEKRGITHGASFGVFEFQPEGDERLLAPADRVVELVSYWQRLADEEKGKGEDTAAAKKAKKKTMGACNFTVFKVHMYFEPPAEDEPAQHEMFLQAAFDVCHRYPVGPEDAIQLAGLQLQAAAGNKGLKDLEARVGKFLAPKYCDKERGVDVAAVVAQLKAEHAKHKGKSRQAAEAEYLAVVKDWKVYGSTFWHVEPQMNAELPEAVILAINPKGILVIHPTSFEVRF
jgi:hypothetical protein